MKSQFEIISALDEEMMVEYVSSAVEMTLKNLDKCHFTDAELALRLLFIYADAFKGQVRLSKAEKNNDAKLTNLLQLMVQSSEMILPSFLQCRRLKKFVGVCFLFCRCLQLSSPHCTA